MPPDPGRSSTDSRSVRAGSLGRGHALRPGAARTVGAPVVQPKRARSASRSPCWRSSASTARQRFPSDPISSFHGFPTSSRSSLPVRCTSCTSRTLGGWRKGSRRSSRDIRSRSRSDGADAGESSGGRAVSLLRRRCSARGRRPRRCCRLDRGRTRRSSARCTPAAGRAGRCPFRRAARRPRTSARPPPRPAR